MGEEMTTGRNNQLLFTTDQVKQWQNEGITPNDLSKRYLKEIEQCSKQSAIQGQKLTEYYDQFPDATPEEMIKAVFNVPRTLSQKESDQHLSKRKNIVEFHDFLLKNWERLETEIITKQLGRLYNTVDPFAHFGIARFIADQMNHLPTLLDSAKIQKTGENEYRITAVKELKENRIKTLEFSYPFTAQNLNDAHNLAEKIKEKILGKCHKIWQACWLYANEIKQTQFMAPIIDLMKSCYPKRHANFSSKDKESFYEELRLLRLPEFTLIKEEKRTISCKFHFPFLKVEGSIGEFGSATQIPEKVSINLLAISPKPVQEKMLYVGAPICKASLELNAKDCPLSFFLQIRKNQFHGGKEERTSAKNDFPVGQLIVEAGLQKTHNSNPRVGIQRLSDKLERAKNKLIISNFQVIKNKYRWIVRIFW